MDKIKSFFLEVWLFVSSGLFLGSVAKIIGISLVLLLMTNWWLKCYTYHGESVQVDDFTGMHISDAQKKGRSKGFRFEVIDSAWVEGKPSGIIIRQNPDPLARVKEGRRIYVTLTGHPKVILLPSFSESSYDFEQYSRRLQVRHGIKSKIKERVYDRKQAENTILHFYYNGKKVTDSMVKKGFKVPEGATLEFAITERRTNKVEIPDLICMEFDAADFLISTYNLHIGKVFEDVTVTDRNTAHVFKQEPAYTPEQTIPMGAQINIWLTQDLPPNCRE